MPPFGSMQGRFGGRSVPKRVEFIADTLGTGTTSTNQQVTIPAHFDGDLILVVCGSTTSTVPTLPVGWTNAVLVVNSGSTQVRPMRMFYKISDGTLTTLDITTVTTVGLRGSGCMVFRNAVSVGATAAYQVTTVDAFARPFSALSLQNTDGTSVVVGATYTQLITSIVAGSVPMTLGTIAGTTAIFARSNNVEAFATTNWNCTTSAARISATVEVRGPIVSKVWSALDNTKTLDNDNDVSSWGGPIAFPQTVTANRPAYDPMTDLVAFTRTSGHFLNAGSQTLNIATNGGFTAVFSVRFTGTGAFSERIFDFGSGAPNNNVLVSRYGMTANINIHIVNGTTPIINNLFATGNAIVQNQLAVFAVRYRAYDLSAMIFKNDVVVASGSASVAITDRTVTTSYIGRSLWAVDAYTNASVQGLYVYDRALADEEITNLSIHKFGATFGAVRGFSLRRLFTTYAGPVVRVRRSSDSLEQAFWADTLSGTLMSSALAKRFTDLDASSRTLVGTEVSSWGSPVAFLGTAGTRPEYIAADDVVRFTAANLDYLNAGTQSFPISTNGGFTAVVMARFSGAVGSAERIFDFGNGASTDTISLNRSGTSSDLRFRIRNGTTDVTSACLATGVIIQNEMAIFAVRYRKSDNSAQIYKNNELVASLTGVATLPDRTVTETYIGRSETVNYFNGDIRGLYVYNYALTDSEIQSVILSKFGMPGVSGPEYDAFVGSGTGLMTSAIAKRWSDLDTSSVTLSGTEVSSWGSPIAFVGTAGTRPDYSAADNVVRFTRANADYLNAGTQSFPISTNGGFTAVVMARFSGTVGSWERIFDFSTPSTGADGIFLNRYQSTSTLNFVITNGTTSIINLQVAGAIVQNELAVIVVRYRKSDNSAQIYKNNELIASVTGLAAVTDRTVTSTYIGRSYSASDAYFNGDVRGLYVYNYALTDTEIQNIAQVKFGLTGALGAIYDTGTGYISQLHDQTGQGYHATQTTSTNQPWIVKGASWTSMPTMRCGGVGFLAYDGATNAIVNTNYTVAVTTARTSSAALNFNFGGSDASGTTNQNFIIGYRTNTSFTHAQLGNDYDSAVSGYTVALPETYVVRHSSTLTKNTYRNGTFLGSGASTVALGAYAGAQIGRWQTATPYYGDISSIIMFDSYLSDKRRQIVEADLGSMLGSPASYAPLDLISTAAKSTCVAAYSLRQASVSYTGPIVRLRRPSDSVEADFTAAQFDSGAVAAWAGTETPTVVTLMDQSGGGNHLTQSTVANQPSLRVLERAIRFDQRPILSTLSQSAQTSCMAAFAFRSLFSNYMGSVIVRLRRESDNVESDFYGPDPTASIDAWIGVSSARVVTLYDQSSNGRHATQATAANQPQVSKQQGSYVAYFNGTFATPQFLGFTGISPTSFWSQYYINALNNGFATLFATAGGDHGFRKLVMTATNGTNYDFLGSDIDATPYWYINGTYGSNSQDPKSVSLQTWNRVTGSRTTASTSAINQIGRGYTPQFRDFNGYMAELVFFSSAAMANDAALLDAAPYQTNTQSRTLNRTWNVFGASTLAQMHMVSATRENVRGTNVFFTFTQTGGVRFTMHAPWNDGVYYLDIGSADPAFGRAQSNFNPATATTTAVGATTVISACKNPNALTGLRLNGGTTYSSTGSTSTMTVTGVTLGGTNIGSSHDLFEWLIFNTRLPIPDEIALEIDLQRFSALGFNADGLVGWYTASSWTGSQWTDLSGAGNHAVTVTGSIQTNSTGLNGQPYLFGGTTAGIRFPAAILPLVYTLFHVAKYNGATRGRIFDGVTGGITNWLSGFNRAMAGKAYHNNWITPDVDVHGTNWVVSSDQNALYRSNKVDRTIAAPGTPSYDQIGLNYGYYGEPSDWACAEVIVFNRTLTTPEIEKVEGYLYGKYGF